MLQEFVQSVRESMRSVTEGMHTAIPCHVKSVDIDKCLVDVLPDMYLRKPDNSTLRYPTVNDLPILFPQVMGQEATIAFPVHEGDQGLMIVAEQSLDYWRYEHETDTELHFDLSDAVFLPGIWNQPNEVMADACRNDKIILDLKGTRVTVMDKLVQIDSQDVVVNCEHMLVNGSFTTINGIDNLN